MQTNPTPNKIIPFPQLAQTAFNLTPLLKPISPSGEFNPTEDTLTSDGRPKPKECYPLRSYTDFARMHAYLMKTAPRDAHLLTIGIATGLRVSDILSLKVGHLIQADPNGNPIFRESIIINEKKTGKSTKGSDDTVYITEAVRDAATSLFNIYTSKGKFLSLDNWLFQSKQPQRNEYTEDDDGNIIPNPLFGQKVYTKSGAHKSFKDASRVLDLPYNVGTHTMRKTFACLYYIFSSQSIGKNAAALEDVQLALRHSNSRVTSRYLQITKEHSKLIRNMISDFLMGKSELEEIKL